MIVHNSIQNVVNFLKISWYVIAHYLDLVQLWCVSLTFSSAFVPFESLQQYFSFFQNGSKFQNFGLGKGEIKKSISNLPTELYQ